MLRHLLCLFLALSLFACPSAPEFPDEPVITYVGISKDTILQYTDGMLERDSIVIQFSFTDGDGDISTQNDSLSDVLLFDSRFDTIPTPFNLPLVTGGNTSNGISGDIFIRLINAPQLCCIRARPGRPEFRETCVMDPSFPFDTFSYGIQLIDLAGNVSNMIRTETIYIQCLAE